MAVERMHHVGVVVEDLPAACSFFSALGLELENEATVEGAWVGRIIGLDGVRSQIAMMATPDGHGRVELARFESPPGPPGNEREPSNAPGLRHLSFLVDDLDATIERLRPQGAELLGEVERYENIYRLCYLRGPEGIIVELAERIG